MRARAFSLVLVAMMYLWPAADAQAAMAFGRDEHIRFIQDVKVTGPGNEPLFLGYLVATQFFVAGVYFHDGGYVLGVKDDRKKYYPMPTGDDLKGLQRRGLLPDPLPPFSPSIIDYLFGYSLWIILVGVALWYGIKWMVKRDAPDAAAG
jgi:hypothetical protein